MVPEGGVCYNKKQEKTERKMKEELPWRQNLSILRT